MIYICFTDLFRSNAPVPNDKIFYVLGCARPLGLEGIKNKAIKITSPARLNLNYRPSSARLNGPFAWCTSKQANILTYLQIELGKAYKFMAIATQGGTVLDKWVKRYRISFKTGPTNVFYCESGLTKVSDQYSAFNIYMYYTSTAIFFFEHCC